MTTRTKLLNTIALAIVGMLTTPAIAQYRDRDCADGECRIRPASGLEDDYRGYRSGRDDWQESRTLRPVTWRYRPLTDNGYDGRERFRETSFDRYSTPDRDRNYPFREFLDHGDRDIERRYRIPVREYDGDIQSA